MLRTLADRLMLFPSRGPTWVEGLTREEIPHGQGVVELWSGRSPAAMNAEPQKCVICFHGNGSRGDREFFRMPRLWGRFPVDVYAMNYPGYGQSTGPATLALLADAATRTFDAVAERANGRPILLAGHSMGTVAALAVCARRPTAGMVLHNPPPLRQIIHGRFGWWNLWLGSSLVRRGVPPSLDSLSNARAAKAPAVFLLAARDGLVTPRYQRMIVDAYAGDKRVVDLPNARHNTPVMVDDLPMIEPAMDWLWERSTVHIEGVR